MKKEKEGGKYLVKENIFFVEEKKNREGIEENVWRRKIYFFTEELLEHWLWKY